MPELTHKQTVNRQLDVAEELERLAAKDTLTGEDETYWSDLVTENDELERHRKHLERQADIERVRKSELMAKVKNPRARLAGSEPDDMDSDPFGEPDSIEDKRFKNPFDLSEMRTFNRTDEQVGQELRARALSAVEQLQGVTTPQRQRMTEVLETQDTEDGRIARFALTTSHPDYLRAFVKMARGAAEGALTAEERGSIDRVKSAARAMSLTDSAGGYLVPFQLDPSVIITSDGSLNEIRQAARQVVATGDVWNGVSSGAVTWSWKDEAAPATDNSTTFGQPTVDIHKANGFVPISLEALQDAQNVTSEVGRLLLFGKDTLESEAFISGTGVGEPQGIVDALSGGAQVVNTAANDTFAVGDLYSVDGSLPARYRRRGSYLGSRLIYNAIRQFDTSGGAALWTQLGSDVPNRLLGRPAYEAEEMDGTTANDDEILVFGDFDNYVIADRIGFTVEFIPHLFRQQTAGTGFGMPTGQRGWYAYYRVGADVVNAAAFRLLTVGAGS
jgi:HK97 family phage major capsid protein